MLPLQLNNKNRKFTLVSCIKLEWAERPSTSLTSTPSLSASVHNGHAAILPWHRNLAPDYNYTLQNHPLFEICVELLFI